MTDESITKELRNIQAHAALTQHWAGELIKKIEGNKIKKERKVKGLTAEDRARNYKHAIGPFLKK